MATKKQPVKKEPEPAQQAESMATEPEPQRESTTIQVRNETKAKLEILKGMFNQPDYNSTLARIIEFIPQKLSTEEEIHLIMPVSRFRWLMAHQDSCDCRNALNDAKV